MDLSKPQWRAGVNQVLGSSWTPYTPALTASTTNPTGWTAVGYWYQVGALVHVKGSLTAGSSMTAGSGTYRISLPTAANATLTDAMTAGSLYLYDASSGFGGTHGAVYIAASTYAQMLYGVNTAAATIITAAAPWTWAASDVLKFAFVYEPAAPA